MLKFKRNDSPNRWFTLSGYYHSPNFESQLVKPTSDRIAKLYSDYPQHRRVYMEEFYRSAKSGTEYKNIYVYALSTRTLGVTSDLTFQEFFITQTYFDSAGKRRFKLVDWAIDWDSTTSNDLDFWGVYNLPGDWDSRSEGSKVVWLFNAGASEAIQLNDSSYFAFPDFLRLLSGARYGYGTFGEVREYESSYGTLVSKQISSSRKSQ